jgi:signal peptide peptidase SppA
VKYSRILQAFLSSTWAILPQKYEAMKAVLKLRASGGQVSDEEIQAVVQAAKRPSPKTAGNVAVIPIYGVICYRGDMFTEASGMTSVQSLTKMFRQAINDDNIKAIIFDVDSPGGTVDGVQELADEIYNARGAKPIVAIANTMAASAAYWLASSAKEVIVTPSGEVGSIGVFMCHEDWSKFNESMGVKPTYISAGKYKTEGNPDEPLSDDARAHFQSDVDAIYGTFTSTVARNRNVKPAEARGDNFGQGRMIQAKDAVKQGMADRVATLDQTLSRFGASGQVRQMEASRIQTPEISAAAASNENGCDCQCAACQADDCQNCTNTNCEDENCKGCPQQMDDGGKARSAGPAKANENGCGCECVACLADDCAACTNTNCEDDNCKGCPQQIDDAGKAAAASKEKIKSDLKKRRRQNEAAVLSSHVVKQQLLNDSGIKN